MTSSLTFRGASLSSSPAHQGTYDVFLSFRGNDTRRNFTSHLYDALDRRGIITFTDDEDPRREKNPSGLLKAIEESRTSVVVISQNYASSSACLCELQKIFECKETKGQLVLPVFYHVDPSDVRHQKNSFEKALAKHEKWYDDKLIVQWKVALSKIGNLPGWTLSIDSDEAKCIGEIVQKIANHIKAAKQVAKHPIAIKSPLHVPDSSSSPAQVPDSSSSPSPAGIESPALVPDSPSSPSPVGTQAPAQVLNLSSSPSGNGEQGSNPSISSEQGSNSSYLSLGVILFLISTVIGILQLGDFETHPINMWISEAALVMFCLSWVTMMKIDGTRWAKYSRINKNFCVLSGLLVPVSLSSIHLPHQLWWLFFFIWALLGFIFVAHTWIYSGANRRNDEEIGLMMSLIRPTNSLTPVENSSDAAHS